MLKYIKHLESRPSRIQWTGLMTGHQCSKFHMSTEARCTHSILLMMPNRPISRDITNHARRAVRAACFVEDKEAFFYTRFPIRGKWDCMLQQISLRCLFSYNYECCFHTRCIERPGALIQGINRMQPAMMTSPDVYDYYDVWKWRNRLTLWLNVAENTNYMKKSFK